MTIFFLVTLIYSGNRLLSRLSGEEPTCDAGDVSSIPGSGRYAQRKWQRIPVFLPGKSHGQRNLVVYSPWDHKRGHDLTSKQKHRRNNKGFFFLGLLSLQAFIHKYLNM